MGSLEEEERDEVIANSHYTQPHWARVRSEMPMKIEEKEKGMTKKEKKNKY